MTKTDKSDSIYVHRKRSAAKTAHGGVSMWLKYQDERDENTRTPKLMFATNNRLHGRDQSGALTRRLLII